MVTDSAILAPTFTSGARTGLGQTTIECRPSEILRDRTLRRPDRDSQRGARREVGRGGTSLRYRAAPRGQAFLLNFNTRITGFALPAPPRVNKRISAAVRPHEHTL